MSTCQCVFSYYSRKKQDFHANNFINPISDIRESYVGPSSYTTSYSTSDINDYPSVGNFGHLINMQNPQISSSFTSYGTSDSGELESTSYINYPPQTTTVIHGETPTQNHKIPQQLSQNAISTSNFNLYNHPSSSSQTSSFDPISSQTSSFNPISPSQAQSFSHQISPSQSYSFNPAIPQDFASLISSTFDNLVGKLPPPSSEVISEHVEVTRPVAVPVYKKFP